MRVRIIYCQKSVMLCLYDTDTHLYYLVFAFRHSYIFHPPAHWSVYFQSYIFQSCIFSAPVYLCYYLCNTATTESFFTSTMHTILLKTETRSQGGVSANAERVVLTNEITLREVQLVL